MDCNTLRGNLIFAAYIVIATLYLGIQMFQGLSPIDIGVYMSGYQHFNEEPYTLYYLGQWLMTYSFSGWLCDVLSINSFLGLRVLHLVYVMFLQTVVYLYLRRYIPCKYIVVGLSLATLAHFGSYTEINYNDYSSGLLTLAVLAYHKGLSGCKAALLAVGGVISATAFFFRIVNITFVIVPFLSWALSYRYATGVSVKRQFAWFFAGYAAGLAAMSGIMAANGTFGVFMLTLVDIVSIGGNADDPHSIKSVILSTWSLYKGEVGGFSVVLLAAVAMVLAFERLQGWGRTAAVAFLAFMICFSINFWEPPSNITIGMCICALVVMFFSGNYGADMANLYALSLLVPMVMPIGSNAGPDFYGKDVCFLSLPLAVYIIRESRLYGRFHDACMKAMSVLFVAISCTMVYVNINRPQMEDGNRLQCLYQAGGGTVSHILTTKDNADMHKYIFKTLKPVVPPGSYLVCNFSQLVVSMLECKMWGVTVPRFSSNMMNERYISVAYKHTGKLPFLLLDKHNANDADLHVRKCLERIRPYRTVWEDERFVLLKDV